jgi:hypothetical protein
MLSPDMTRPANRVHPLGTLPLSPQASGFGQKSREMRGVVLTGAEACRIKARLGRVERWGYGKGCAGCPRSK